MKNLFKILILTMIFMFSINSSFAFSVSKLEKHIKSSNLNDTATLAISIRDVESGNVIYEQNQNKLLHPASTLKLFTTYSSLNTLGYDYLFKTQFYKDKQGDLYIKLGADPLLTSSQLQQAFQKLKAEGNTSFKNLYFDDSIIDKKEFAPGWMWDDDTNPYTPKVSSYNLDGNIVRVAMTNNPDGFAQTTLKSTYPMSVISVVKTGAKSDYLEVNRYNWMNPEVVEIYGNLKAAKPINIPISSMRRYFIHNVEKALESNKINISNTLYSSKIVPSDAVLITEITNPISRTISSILHNSNNLMVESIFKLASAKKYSATGTDFLGEEVFKEFYNKLGLETDNILIKDGCGVSRKNLLYADWMTQALNKIYQQKDFEKFRDNMAQSGDGTLNNRLYPLRGEVWLKTGSLSNVSAIAGYVKSQDGHTYSIVILTQNFIQEQSTVKKFEDEIINIIYNR
ncbi:TPA: D-alanyl-D-alanine carboxypeptidase/D-alanyl-D-alanine-endopeptidase [Candidatus Avigastranaerophilus faecigallinarum]|nr:D-alanyl-D-alanine carboxypeptidase/D-alanyl-D-alanine-endopeptidase [Candidatus Avigastranaerophilus faecigallinarum]